ncbi:MAG: dicarboxylate/amino acid:cation symporter [Acidobacteriota bacterium]
MKEGTRVLIALALALIVGLLIAGSGNASWLRGAGLIAPLGTLWVNAIRMTIIPLMVSILISGVASVSDVRAIGRLGGRTLVVFLLLLTGMCAVIIPLAVGAFHLAPHFVTYDPSMRPPMPEGALEAAGQLAADKQAVSFAAWVTSLLPTNPIAAAANGQMLPLVIFTLLLALAIAKSPTAARQTLLNFFQALSEAMLILVRWVVALAPIGVFALVLPMAAHGGAGLAGTVGFYVVVYSLGCILMTLLLYPVAAIGGGISMRRFARAALPGQMIAFSSSSSLASLPALIEGAERDLELPERVTGFVLPLAVSTFKIAGPVSWTIGALFVGWFYGVELHALQLGTIAFAAIFLAFAVPGVPRGAFLMLTPLFLAIGLPAEGIGILIAVDVIPDLFATVLNTTGDITAAALVGRGSRREGEAGAAL